MNADARHEKGSFHYTRAHTWQQMQVYLHLAWSKLSDRVKSSSIIVDKAQELFSFSYVTHDRISNFVQDKLVIRKILPEPD